MARKVRNASLDTRAARSRLGIRGKPYYFALDPGLHLGYRKLRGGAGKWVVRLYVGDQDYDTETIATADDTSDATFSDREIAKAQIKDSDVLTFSQAQAIARRLRDQRSRSAAGITGPYTVSKALEDYFAFLRTEGRPDHLVSDTGTASGCSHRAKAW